MKKRLETLREKLDVQWKDMAELLGISVPMLGCLRRGERNPSQKVLSKIEALEQNGVVLHDIVSDTAMEYRMTQPMHLLSSRERAAQYAVSAFDSAQSAGKAGQFETLMLHIAGVVTHDESYAWHRIEIDNIIDRHFA